MNGLSKPLHPRNPAAKKPAITVSPARAAAFEILERVAVTDAHSDDLLHSSRLSELSQADRNLATTLVLGVLRWQIALDALIKPLLSRPDAELAVPVATALRLGAFQLRYLDRIPAHAALSESVELARSAGHGHAAGMVNAILRGLTRAAVPKVPLYETTAAMGERLSHPAWLVRRWETNYGRAGALAICEYDQSPPERGTLFGAESDETLPTMDDGSRLVAELAAASVKAPRRIWDCCAAPGGKTMVMARRHPEADVLATDVSPVRLRRLAERLKPVAPQVRTAVADATKPLVDEAEFDLILCDAPCSGTGTLSRNPELKLRLQPADLSRQAVRQRELLLAALERLAPGGRLVYSTCSLEPEENEQVVQAVLAKAPAGVVAAPLEPVMARLGVEGSGLVKDGRLRTVPGRGFRGDGFFAALFERR
ncbi:methyltransferase domain-containing protein [Granulicella sp. 5B5]|nr:methyltransferase domain-containing protein [Granulicella sp. 5B5]